MYMALMIYTTISRIEKERVATILHLALHWRLQTVDLSLQLGELSLQLGVLCLQSLDRRLRSPSCSFSRLL
jgi:hypothetical protein